MVHLGTHTLSLGPGRQTDLLVLGTKYVAKELSL